MKGGIIFPAGECTNVSINLDIGVSYGNRNAFNTAALALAMLRKGKVGFYKH